MIEEIQKQHLEAMIDYKKITKIDIGQVHFTPDMVIQACKDSVKAAIPLILEKVSEKAHTDLYIKGHYKKAKWRVLKDGDEYNPLENDIMSKIDKKSIKSLQDTLEKQLGI